MVVLYSWQLNLASMNIWTQTVSPSIVKVLVKIQTEVVPEVRGAPPEPGGWRCVVDVRIAQIAVRKCPCGHGAAAGWRSSGQPPCYRARGELAAWALTAGLKRVPAERREDRGLEAGTASGAACLRTRSAPFSSTIWGYQVEPLLIIGTHLNVTQRWASEAARAWSFSLSSFCILKSSKVTFSIVFRVTLKFNQAQHMPVCMK